MKEFAESGLNILVYDMTSRNLASDKK